MTVDLERLIRLRLLPALARARVLHPDGTLPCHVLDEAEELRHAVAHETLDRVRAEALDVAITALRVYMGGDAIDPSAYDPTPEA